MTPFLAPPPALLPGLADPVFDSQQIFRGLLRAFSHPGLIVDLAIASLPANPVAAAATGVLLTILDCHTPLWLDAAARDTADFFRFHCGCPIVDDPAHGAFAFILDPRSMPSFSAFSAGSAIEPERSATLVIVCDGLAVDPAGWRLSGPGIADATFLAAEGLAVDFGRWLTANHARFPEGLDVVLCHGTRIAALPRTTRIEE